MNVSFRCTQHPKPGMIYLSYIKKEEEEFAMQNTIHIIRARFYLICS